MQQNSNAKQSCSFRLPSSVREAAAAGEEVAVATSTTAAASAVMTGSGASPASAASWRRQNTASRQLTSAQLYRSFRRLVSSISFGTGSSPPPPPQSERPCWSSSGGRLSSCRCRHSFKISFSCSLRPCWSTTNGMLVATSCAGAPTGTSHCTAAGWQRSTSEALRANRRPRLR